MRAAKEICKRTSERCDPALRFAQIHSGCPEIVPTPPEEIAQIIDRKTGIAGIIKLAARQTAKLVIITAQNKEMVEALQYISDRECEEWEMSDAAYHALTKHQGESDEQSR